MKSGDKLTFKGVEYVFWKESGDTHFYAQELGNANSSLRRISYADFIEYAAAQKGTNVRFEAFMILTSPVAKGVARNLRFMHWVNDMLVKFAATKGATHTPINPYHLTCQDEFTKFILASKKEQNNV